MMKLSINKCSCPHQYPFHRTVQYWPCRSRYSKAQRRRRWRRWKLPLLQTHPSSEFRKMEGRRTRSYTWCGRRSSLNQPANKPLQSETSPCTHKFNQYHLCPKWVIAKKERRCNLYLLLKLQIKEACSEWCYQQVMKRMTAQARAPPGRSPRPQQKHLLTTMMRTWLTRRKRKAPTPSPVDMSVSYWQ